MSAGDKIVWFFIGFFCGGILVAVILTLLAKHLAFLYG